MDYDKLFWQQRQLERALNNIRPFITRQDAAYHELAEHLRELEQLNKHFTLPAGYLASYEEIKSSIDQMSLCESEFVLNQIDPSIVEEIGKIEDRYSRITAELDTYRGLDASRICPVLEETLTATEAMLRITEANNSLPEILLAPNRSFCEYSSYRLERAIDASEMYKLHTIQAVDIGTEILTDMINGLEHANFLKPIETHIESIPSINAFKYLNGYLDAEVDFEDEADLEDSIEEINLMTIISLGSKIVELVYKLNAEAEREGRKGIFKPTSKIMRSCYIIPTRLAKDEKIFEDIVDQLYVLIYEGTGKGQRLTENIDQNKLGDLWRLKHLRLASCHDVDHGGKADIRKKNKNIGAAFKRFCGTSYPVTDMEWLMAQKNLYEAIVKILEKLWYD